VLDSGREAISKSMQLVSGRTAQAFNLRKRRKGAFWEDRYHGTDIETGHHLVACLTYIDLNMVRAGVVAHPCQWEFGGYAEIQSDPVKDSITDCGALMELLRIDSIQALRKLRGEWVEERLARGELAREGRWTESVAVGSRDFTERIKAKLGLRAKGRRVSGSVADTTLREPQELLGFGWRL